LPVETSDMHLLEQFFSEKAGHKVYVVFPQRGDKAKLVETANINAREESERASTYEEKALKTHEWLANALNLDKTPSRIEAYDISNTGKSDIVASMTVFERGRPCKKDYRRFKIKTLSGQNDLAAMNEVVLRRVRRFIDDDDKFSQLPDIVLIDGGAVHAGAAQKALEASGVTLPVFGMVKDDKHKTRALVSPDGEEIGLAGNPAVFALIGTIQEETHRFAVEYHRKLRSKSSYKSKLDEVAGIGIKRRNDLLKSFGSIKAIKAASIDDLAKVVPKNAAKMVYEHFNPRHKEG